MHLALYWSELPGWACNGFCWVSLHSTQPTFPVVIAKGKTQQKAIRERWPKNFFTWLICRRFGQRPRWHLTPDTWNHPITNPWHAWPRRIQNPYKRVLTQRRSCVQPWWTGWSSAISNRKICGVLASSYNRIVDNRKILRLQMVIKRRLKSQNQKT